MSKSVCLENSSFTDALTDYEPYSAKFEDIFRDYCDNQDRKVWSMQCLAYWVEPVILMENDGSYTARKNDSDGVKVGDTDAWTKERRAILEFISRQSIT